MSDTRQDILTKLNTCLPYITTTNSYNNTIANVKRGYVGFNEVNQYPSACYFLGSEKRIADNETDSLNKYQIEIKIGIYDKVAADHSNSGTLTNKLESWIADLKTFITNPSNKGMPKYLGSTSCLQELYIDSIEPYIDYQENIVAIFLTLTGVYVE